MSRRPQPIVAAFDFDKTITDRDSFIAFLLSLFGRTQLLLAGFYAFPQLLGWCFGLVSRQGIKERMLRYFFRGTSYNEYAAKCHTFAQEELPRYVKPAALARLQWHLEEKHHCVLISASLESYLEPWAKQVGFHDVIASKVEVDPSGHLTGKLMGKNCRDAEKVRRLEEQLGPKSDYELYAYGDSRGDAALLAIADHPFYRIMPEPK